MNEEAIALARVLRKDPRYAPDAYFFVREALGYAADSLELRQCNCRGNSGGESSAELTSGKLNSADELAALGDCGHSPQGLAQFAHESSANRDGNREGVDGEDAVRAQCHVTGQQLCEGIRQYALAQFGLMSKVVLNSWGVYSTSDFGEIVYNLIKVGVLKKSPRDRRAHFDAVYDFDEAFASEDAVSAAFPAKLASIR